jgi:hypothetical protein
LIFPPVFTKKSTLEPGEEKSYCSKLGVADNPQLTPHETEAPGSVEDIRKATGPLAERDHAVIFPATSGPSIPSVVIVPDTVSVPSEIKTL